MRELELWRDKVRTYITRRAVWMLTCHRSNCEYETVSRALYAITINS